MCENSQAARAAALEASGAPTQAGEKRPTGARADGSRPYAPPFPVPPLSYEEALPIASDTGFMGSTEGPLLEVVVALLDELGRPDAAYDCIQVAGTNGKTSTVRFTAAILRGEGLSTMLYTSPQLVRFNERIEIDGAPVSDELFAWGVSAAGEAGRRVNARRAAAGMPAYTVSAFDVLTVAAFCIAAREQVDVAVLEVGLGGRWDATSAANPCVVGVTGIGLDHMKILGNTLAEIAGEKAAIIKPGRREEQSEGTHEPSVEQVMRAQCAAAGVEPFCSGHRLLSRPTALGDPVRFAAEGAFSSYELALVQPAYQAQNAACAVALAEQYLGRPLDTVRLQRSLDDAPVPGRFQVLRREPFAMIDACHNPQSVETFIGCLDEVAPRVEDRPTLLFAVLADKDVAGIAALLAPAFPRAVVTATRAARALSAEDAAELLRAQGLEPSAVYATVDEAVAALTDRNEGFIACGTITLAGEVAALFA